MLGAGAMLALLRLLPLLGRGLFLLLSVLHVGRGELVHDRLRRPVPVVDDLRWSRRRPAAELALLVALFVAVPPLVAFAGYFGCWHALPAHRAPGRDRPGEPG